MEWNNPYNSFNSQKGLAYYERYKEILSWLKREIDYLPPPVECNLDPMAECNNRCYFCITQRYLVDKREEVGQMRQLSYQYMRDLVDFLSGWGVRGLCISGGGEPSLSPSVHSLPSYAVSKGMDTCFVTNATTITDTLAENLMQCRWVALSVNAGDRDSYRKVAGKDYFDKIVSNVGKLGIMRHQGNWKVDLCYKFLLLPENVHTMYTACKLAKSLGAQDFHVHPADFEREDIKGHKPLTLDREYVLDQFEKCHAEEMPDFHVYTVTHKFDSNFHNVLPFEKCLATPLLLAILTDGNGYLCVDTKMMSEYRLGSAYPDPENILTWWGSEKHRQLIESVIPHQDCKNRRCTFGQYHKQMEDAILKDRMCLSFP